MNAHSDVIDAKPFTDEEKAGLVAEIKERAKKAFAKKEMPVCEVQTPASLDCHTALCFLLFKRIGFSLLSGVKRRVAGALLQSDHRRVTRALFLAHFRWCLQFTDTRKIRRRERERTTNSARERESRLLGLSCRAICKQEACDWIRIKVGPRGRAFDLT